MCPIINIIFPCSVCQQIGKLIIDFACVLFGERKLLFFLLFVVSEIDKFSKWVPNRGGFDKLCELRFK